MIRKALTYFKPWGQFHQCSTCSFYIRKLRAQLFCAYDLGLYFIGARLLAQKLRVEHWWNWPLDGEELIKGVSVALLLLHALGQTLLLLISYLYTTDNTILNCLSVGEWNRALKRQKLVNLKCNIVKLECNNFLFQLGYDDLSIRGSFRTENLVCCRRLVVKTAFVIVEFVITELCLTLYMLRLRKRIVNLFVDFWEKRML